MENATQQKTLSELREEKAKEKGKFVKWLRKHCPYFFDWRSLFWYGVMVLLIGILWMIAGLVRNSGAQLYGWDHELQYVTFTYDFWDVWHEFFRTGHFQLYSTSTYLGADNIGSNSYYGLFDPFLFICYIFPKSWIPQTFTWGTLAKGICSALAMRAYAKYLGVSEKSSRIGGIVYAFCGYVCFFEGFPSFVSMAVAVPWILLGIEKVLKEQKPLTLCLGIAFMGLVSFFFLVVVCIFGVLYAIWRYFATLKSRTVKRNFATIGLGVAAFAVGIMLCAWVLLPSIRNSTLSGRTNSVGSAYLQSIADAFKGQDFGTIFSRLFEMVGNHPMRELQGLISFFYPTCNYLYLPLVRSGYDSWTSSLFCYTPVVILFFIALFSSIRRKKWSHLVIFAICCYLVFTNFAYFFFYAFTGAGYGRWYIVLVPLIIFYAMSELDRLKEEKPWVVISGCLTALALAAFTWIFISLYVPGRTFERVSGEWDGYWQTSYTVPAISGGYDLGWLVYYQLILYVIIGAAYVIFRKKEWLHQIIFVCIIGELTVAGNLSFFWGNTCSVQDTFNGGASTMSQLTTIWNDINASDSSYFRGHTDGLDHTNTQMAFSYNGTSTFHSLFNYDLAQLTRYSHITNNEYTTQKYGYDIQNKSWSGYYGNKRLHFDTALGMKYYVIKEEGYAEEYDYGGSINAADNVPFGSELVKDYGNYRVYKNTYMDTFTLGHAVLEETYYKANSSSTGTSDDFYSGESIGNVQRSIEILRNEQIYVNGAIISDDQVEAFEQEDLWEEGQEKWTDAPMFYTGFTSVNYQRNVYKNDYLWWGPDKADGSGKEGPTYFLSDPNTEIVSSPNYSDLVGDYDKVVLTPSQGTYFNDEWGGAYFAINYNLASNSDGYNYVTRVYMIGDRINEETGEVEENVLLNYEYNTLRDYCRLRIGNYSNVYGFYPQGKVKYICFCGKSGDGKKFPTSSLGIYKMDRSQIDGEEGMMSKLTSSEYGLSDVTYSSDRFTFKTNFSKNRLVVTALGYDSGWKVTATDESGNHYSPNVYKLDGGFVGFVAPGGVGEVTYTLSYHTPYLREGFILMGIGLFLLVGYELGRGLYRHNKKKNEGSDEEKGNDAGIDGAPIITKVEEVDVSPEESTS